MEKIKKSITAKEYKILMNYTRSNPNIRVNTRNNLLKIYTLLYYTGARLNELTQLRNSDILGVLEGKELIITTYKTKNERELFFTSNGIKEIRKIFSELGIYDEPSDYKLIRVKGKPYSTPNKIAFIQGINKAIREVLGDKYTSHSFRQGFITELGAKSVNPKIIQHFIGHRDIKTTMRYIKPTESDIINALVR